MVKYDLTVCIDRNFVESKSHIHSLQEITTKLILQVLFNLIEEIDKQGEKFCHKREKIDIGYFRVPFELDVIFKKRHCTLRGNL